MKPPREGGVYTQQGCYATGTAGAFVRLTAVMIRGDILVRLNRSRRLTVTKQEVWQVIDIDLSDL